MSTLDLEQMLIDLPLPDGTDGTTLRFAAIPIEGMGGHRLGRGSNGEPALLFTAATGTTGRRPPRIELEHITVQHDVTCWITTPAGEHTSAPFTVVQFSGGDTQLRRYFLRIAGALIASLGSAPTSLAVQDAVRQLVELFRVLAQPQRKSVQGLWAELFVLVASTDAETMASAWHSDLEDRYDFSAGDQRIEVKSAEGRVRRHRFSLSQLMPPSDATVLIASVLLERAAGGTSLEDLLDRARKRLSINALLQAKLDQVVALTLGESLPRALGMAFDWELAKQSLRFFSSTSVPSIPCGLPPEVTDVSFAADLSALEPVTMTDLDDGLFAAARCAL